MNVSVQLASCGGCDTGILFAGSDGWEDGAGLAGRYPVPAAPWLAASPALKDFRAQKGEMMTVYGNGEGLARVLLVGLGAAREFDLSVMRECAALALRKCRELGLRAAAFFEENFTIPSQSAQAGGRKSFSPALLLREAVFGAWCGLYRYERFSERAPDPERRPDPDLAVIVAGEAGAHVARECVAEATHACAGVALAREIVTAPANIMTPEAVAAEALQVATACGFGYACYDQEQIRGMGMGAFGAVFQATDRGRLVVLEYAPAAGAEETLVMVGKGVCFDSGGICLKPAASMHEMKSDMAGAAAIIGFFRALGEMIAAGGAPARKIVGIIGCAENMPGPNAVKPGDVVRTFSGKSVEIENTDAEGRLILCDLLSYAQKEWKPDILVDLATLTGACVVALGREVAGLFCEDEALSAAIRANGQTSGELFWPLPLWDMYAKPLRKNAVADLGNMASREGGAIYAAVFLKQFVSSGVAWAHLDIAGPAYSGKESPLFTPGGTGFGVRTLIDLCRPSTLTHEGR